MHGVAHTPGEMETLGGLAASVLGSRAVVALVGGLGAGKTHWTKGLVAGYGCSAEVTSPTFGLVHEYRTSGPTVFHFDFYRLESAEELIMLGWDEYLDAGAVVVVEWADKFPGMLPPETVWLEFGIGDDGSRRVRIQNS
jgi:tRNA threonylcarbamoyladenosine biosynthesis protein TsaE